MRLPSPVMSDVAAREPLIGQKLDHYRITNRIGSGGMGVVYLAYDEQLQREVAVKVISTGLLADESARRRFRKEALALAKLNHPKTKVVRTFSWRPSWPTLLSFLRWLPLWEDSF